MSKKAKSSGGTKIVPLGDKVVLKRQEAESKTAGGIVLPDSAKDKPQKGEVIAIGDGHVRRDGARIPLTGNSRLGRRTTNDCSSRRMSYFSRFGLHSSGLRNRSRNRSSYSAKTPSRSSSCLSS